MAINFKEQLEGQLAQFSLRQISLWGMVVLDPVCAMLNDAYGHGTPNAASTTVLSYQRASKIPYEKAVQTVLSGVRSVLSDILYGRNLTTVYPRVTELTPRAEGLDGLPNPLCAAGHSIYCFLTRLDLIWDAFWDFDSDSFTLTDPDPNYQRVTVRTLAELVPRLAIARSLKDDLVWREAIETATQILREGRGNTNSPLGDPIQPSAVEVLLARARFFSKEV